MNILYFTTAQDTKSFAASLSHYSISPNLSNQNFHNKLIRCLSLSHFVNVISSRPISNYESSTLKANNINEQNIAWNYLKVKNSRLDKFFYFNKRVNKTFKKIRTDNDIIFVDIMNLFLLKSALKLSKKYNFKIIGVCTDNPLNISFTNSYYKNQILKLGKLLDGYICLTDKINELFNTENKPFLIIDGIVEELMVGAPIIKEKYIYFGGSLMEEYGVFALINAFNSLKIEDIKLVIAGHHEPNNFKEKIKDNKNIVYLGAVNYLDNITLEHYSICCVNPRPIDNKIDNYSFPSKVLEYLSNSTLVISTMSPLIYKNYADSIIWSKTEKEIDLLNALKKALSYSQSARSIFIRKSKQNVFNRTSMEVINQKIDQLFFK